MILQPAPVLDTWMTYDVFQLPRLGRLARETLRSGREQVRLYFQLLVCDPPPPSYRNGFSLDTV